MVDERRGKNKVEISEIRNPSEEKNVNRNHIKQKHMAFNFWWRAWEYNISNLSFDLYIFSAFWFLFIFRSRVVSYFVILYWYSMWRSINRNLIRLAEKKEEKKKIS